MSPLSRVLSLASLAAAVSALAVVERSSKRDASLQKRGTYTQAFGGSGTNSDASVSGPGYLTFTRLNSYDIPTCEAWCDQISGCAFINLYNEYNVDSTYNPEVKCVAYTVPHTAADKTNFGGQQLLSPPAGKSYITDSVGYTSDTYGNPPTPSDYAFVFGPINAANVADGFIETDSLPTYNVQMCANMCTHAVDSVGRPCQYFNIWTGVQNGHPSFNCALFTIPTDASTATNTNQGGIQVTNSRGYQTTLTNGGGGGNTDPTANLISDGGFEDYQCGSPTICGQGTDPSGTWIIATEGGIYSNDYPHTGTSCAVILSFTSDPGFIAYSSPLNTIPGSNYVVTIWAATVPGSPSTIDVHWNGVTVLSQALDTLYQYQEVTVTVTAIGNDHLAFYGGANGHGYYVDDISVILA